MASSSRPHFTEGDAEIVVVSGSSSANATSGLEIRFQLSEHVGQIDAPLLPKEKTWRWQLQPPAVVPEVQEPGPEEIGG